MDCPFPLNPQHWALILQREQLLTSAVRMIRDRVPEALEIWCYGINALKPLRPTNDWDFLVFVKASCSASRLEELNALGSPLATLRQIGTQSLDAQAMRVSDHSACARLVRSEGFCIWSTLANPVAIAA